MKIVSQHFQWPKFHIKIHMAGKQCAFLPKRLQKVAFSETLAGISTLSQWTPCNKVRGNCKKIEKLISGGRLLGT